MTGVQTPATVEVGLTIRIELWYGDDEHPTYRWRAYRSDLEHRVTWYTSSTRAGCLSAALNWLIEHPDLVHTPPDYSEPHYPEPK